MDSPNPEVLRVMHGDLVRLITSDMDNASDSLKYSSWIAALATAGFALALSQGKSLAVSSWLGPHRAGAFLLLASVVFLSSIFVSAVVYYTLNRFFELSRRFLDFFSNQYLRLLLRPDDLAKALAAEDFDLHRVYYKMLDGAYLGKTIDGLKDLTDRKMTFQRKRARRLLKTQLILVFLAYVVLFVAGIPSV